MVVIRLARVGRHKHPIYRIFAADKRRAATGKFLAILGTYNPHTKQVDIKKDEILDYLNNGAQASDRVLRLLISQKVELPKWAKTHDRKKAPKNKGEEEASTENKDDATNNADSANTEESAPQKDAEQKSKDQKEDLGTVKELTDEQKQADTTEAVADAVEETTKEQKS